MKHAVVLLSGGLDSATTLAIARHEGYACHALSFDYGQRHRYELEAARKVSKALGVVDHVTAKIDLRIFGHSALTDDAIAVPKDHLGQRGDDGSTIPVTYVPARNTIFLSYALGLAEVTGAMDLFIGVNAVDYSGYPDCRPAFVDAFEKLANLATKVGVEGISGGFIVHAPLINLTKAQIITRGLELGVPYELTHSCYDPDAQGRPCGHCDSCLLRKQGFIDAGTVDPVKYQ